MSKISGDGYIYIFKRLGKGNHRDEKKYWGQNC